MTELSFLERLMIYVLVQGFLLLISVLMYFAMRHRSPIGPVRVRRNLIRVNLFMAFVMLVLFDTLGLFDQQPLVFLIRGVAEAILIVIGRPQ